jgi:anti-anti-sigma factor
MSATPSPVTVPNQLRIDITRPAPSTFRVSVVGEVDLATVPALRDRLLTVVHEQAPAALVVDLAGVTFLDCAGIGTLVAAHNAAIRAGGQVRVSDPHPTVRRLLDLTGLLDVLTDPIDQPRAARAGRPSPDGPGPATVARAADLKAAA